MNIQARELTRAGLLAWAIALCLVGGWCGYEVRERLVAGALVLPAGALPSVEDLSPPESFSRIENTKKNLETLCLRLRLEIQSKIVANGKSGVRERSAQSEEPSPNEAIKDLELGMREFQGTDQQLDLAQELLLALKRLKSFDRWTDVYLKVLYEHPTHRVVSLFANEAVDVSRLAGRQEDVLAGLRHVAAIPLDFEDKDRIEAALLRQEPRFEVAHLEATPLATGK
jgi:hypothetical protein